MMTSKLKIWSVRLGLLATLLIIGGSAAYAADCTNPNLSSQEKQECLLLTEEELIQGSPQGQNEGSQTSLPHGDIIGDFLPFFINTLLAVAGTLIFISLLVAGYFMVFANDNEENIEKGKKILIYSVIGAFVIAISYAVIYGIANLDLD